jgi:hypothetical protein
MLLPAPSYRAELLAVFYAKGFARRGCQRMVVAGFLPLSLFGIGGCLLPERLVVQGLGVPLMIIIQCLVNVLLS